MVVVGLLQLLLTIDMADLFEVKTRIPWCVLKGTY